MSSEQEQILLNSNEVFKSNSANLMNEGFKVKAVLQMMNICADRCNLQYSEKGIKRQDHTETTCFKNCTLKAYKLSKLGLDWWKKLFKRSKNKLFKQIKNNIGNLSRF